jgi:hypothetical protein
VQPTKPEIGKIARKVSAIRAASVRASNVPSLAGEYRPYIERGNRDHPKHHGS